MAWPSLAYTSRIVAPDTVARGAGNVTETVKKRSLSTPADLRAASQCRLRELLWRNGVPRRLVKTSPSGVRHEPETLVGLGLLPRLRTIPLGSSADSSPRTFVVRAGWCRPILALAGGRRL